MPQTCNAGRLVSVRVSSGSPPIDGSAYHTHAIETPLASKLLNGNHIVLSHISQLISQLSKRNYRQTSQELMLVRLL